MEKIRSEALALLDEFVTNANLKKHMLAVEAVMRAYAKRYREDEAFWGLVGLLHDFDYERYPNLTDHPFRGAEVLRERGWPEEFVRSILGHAPHTGEPRDTLLKKVIFSADELTGFIIAVALVRPNKKLAEVTPDTVLKKLREKSFARQVNREEILQGAHELGLPLEQHVEIVLTALQAVASTLSL